VSTVTLTNPALSRMNKQQLVGTVAELQRRVRELERQDTRHRQDQNALRQQALILEQMSDGVIVTDLEGRIIDWNPAAERLFGYPKDEVLGRTPAFLHRPAEAATLTTEIVEDVARGERWSGEITVTCKDSTKRICEVIVVPFYNEQGQRVATIGVNRDIGDRKQVEKALREANESLKKEVAERKRAEQEAARSHTLLTEAVEALSDGFIISDADERLVLCNGKYREIYREVADMLVPGTTLREIGVAAARHCLGIEAPDDIEAAVRQRLILHRSHKGPIEQKLKDDRWILVRESPLANGWTVGVRTDITELKRRETALKASETQFRAMADDSPVIFWINDTDDRPVFLNRAAREFLGLSLEALPVQDFYDRVHPEDRERIRTLDRQSIEQREPRRYEYRMRRNDGAYRWLLEVGVPRLAPDGTFLGTIGSTADITEQKETQEALRQSEARFREIFDESPVSLWEEDWSPLKRTLDDLKQQGIVDLADYFQDNPEQLHQAYDALPVVDISQETLRVYRAKSKAELHAILGSAQAGPSEMAGFAETLEAFAAGSASYEYEAEETACDGTPIITQVRTVLPPRYRDSWSRVLITTNDITEQKRDQRALVQSETRYRELFEESPVAMLEEDWTPVKKFLQDLVAQGVTDIAGYLHNHPDKLGEIYEAPHRFGISQAAVELYHAASAEELRASMSQDAADPDELTGYANMVAAFLDGA